MPNLIRRILRLISKLLFITKFKSIKSKYSKFVATPTYYYYNSHKKIDVATDVDIFSSLSKEIISEGKTYLKQDRLYSLYQSLYQTPNDPVVMEVGVYKGGGTKFIANVLRKLNKSAKIYSCDTFSGHANFDERYDGEHCNKGSMFENNDVKEVKKYLQGYDEVQVVVGDIQKTSDQITSTIDFIHLDVDVYPATLYVLNHFWSQLRTKGSIIVDDYGFTTCKGAKQAVHEFLKDRNDCVFYHLLSGQGLLIKVA